MPNGQKQLTATAYYYNGTQSNVTNQASWSSSDNSQATVNSTGLVTGVSAGSPSITALLKNQPVGGRVCNCIGCPPNRDFSTSATVTVQVPTSLSIVVGTSSTTAESACTTGGLAGCGVTRTFKYQVMDQESPPQPIKIGNMAFGDVICNTSTNQLGLNGYITTCGGMTGSCWGTTGPCGQSTDSNGQFSEKLGACSTVCKRSGTCVTAGQTIANQTWTVAGQKLSSDVKSLSYQCNKVLVNGN